MGVVDGLNINRLGRLDTLRKRRHIQGFKNQEREEVETMNKELDGVHFDIINMRHMLHELVKPSEPG